MAGPAKARKGMDIEDRAASRKRYTSSIITLIVGADKERVTIHEDQLRASSPFFQAALDKRWKEGAILEISMPEDSIDVVIAYINWLYKDKMPHCEDPDQVLFAELYTFGERILDDAFCNTVLSEILFKMEKLDMGTRHIPGGPFIHKLYAGTTDESPARACFVDIYADRALPVWFETVDEYPPEFMHDLVKALTEQRAVPYSYKSRYEEREKWFKKKAEGKDITLTVNSGEDDATRQVELPENVEISAAYLTYLNTGKICWPDGKTTIDTCIDLYKVGEEMSDDEFCNASLTAFCKCLDGNGRGHQTPTFVIINRIYSEFGADCPLRSLVVTIYAEQARQGWLGVARHWDVPVSFLWDVVGEMAKGRGESKFRGFEVRREQWFKRT
ncbi:hypothetical protein HII31_03338 [Pseudocercospora fuligena]|uniref:BTB domain-containing protein n=1 Tax=Pseudocercospora fuligena TaxID=685502 RepID=A0A8H6RQT4_9PEZI|nr:hypothetical protein HII31_03338 [Pseudocercospora fuligena]